MIKEWRNVILAALGILGAGTGGISQIVSPDYRIVTQTYVDITTDKAVGPIASVMGDLKKQLDDQKGETKRVYLRLLSLQIVTTQHELRSATEHLQEYTDKRQKPPQELQEKIGWLSNQLNNLQDEQRRANQ